MTLFKIVDPSQKPIQPSAALWKILEELRVSYPLVVVA